MPTCRCSGSTNRPGPSTSTPAIATRPLVARSTPAITRRTVDFPDPDGPSRQTISPFRTANDTRSTAVTAPKRTVSSSTASITVSECKQESLSFPIKCSPYAWRNARPPWQFLGPGGTSFRRRAAAEDTATASVRHRVNYVIDGEAIREGGHRLGVAGIVGMLPGVAEIHVEVDRDHEAAAIVVDAAPVRRDAV